MPSKTETTREIDWQALIETALTAPGHLGNVYNRFYSYSFMNQMLLLMQGVQEPVATYKRWQAMGRQVVKGAKAKEIVRPITVTRKNDDGEVEASFLRFKAVKCLFTVSQTEGDPLPPAPELPEWSLPRALKQLDIREVPYQLLDGNTQGYSVDRRYAINPVAVHPFKTTLHEVSHITAGHTVPEKLAEYLGHRGVYEFEAEGSAYLVANELQVLPEEQASGSRAYIQTWLQGERPAETSIRRVFATTDAILRAGRLAVEGGDDA